MDNDITFEPGLMMNPAFAGSVSGTRLTVTYINPALKATFHTFRDGSSFDSNLDRILEEADTNTQTLKQQINGLIQIISTDMQTIDRCLKSRHAQVAPGEVVILSDVELSDLFRGELSAIGKALKGLKGVDLDNNLGPIGLYLRFSDNSSYCALDTQWPATLRTVSKNPYYREVSISFCLSLKNNQMVFQGLLARAGLARERVAGFDLLKALGSGHSQKNQFLRIQSKVTEIMSFLDRREVVERAAKDIYGVCARSNYEIKRRNQFLEKYLSPEKMSVQEILNQSLNLVADNVIDHLMQNPAYQAKTNIAFESADGWRHVDEVDPKTLQFGNALVILIAMLISNALKHVACLPIEVGRPQDSDAIVEVRNAVAEKDIRNFLSESPRFYGDLGIAHLGLKMIGLGMKRRVEGGKAIVSIAASS